jgi:hypothetical protein
VREGSSSREKRCEFGDTLHDTPQNSSHNNIREQQASGASFGVGSASSHEQTSADTTAEANQLFPTAGSFPHWATRFIDPAVGFSLAISYGYCYTIAIASEVSAAAVIVSYWTDITPAVVITVGLVLILAINLMSVRFYGETEVFGGR